MIYSDLFISILWWFKQNLQLWHFTSDRFSFYAISYLPCALLILPTQQMFQIFSYNFLKCLQFYILSFWSNQLEQSDQRPLKGVIIDWWKESSSWYLFRSIFIYSRHLNWVLFNFYKREVLLDSICYFLSFERGEIRENLTEWWWWGLLVWRCLMISTYWWFIIDIN